MLVCETLYGESYHSSGDAAVGSPIVRSFRK